MKRHAETDARTLNIQNLFFEKLKSKLPPGMGLAEELSDMLGISLDSAYRRIRCKKTA